MLAEVLQGRLPVGNYCLPLPRVLPMLHLAGRDTTTGRCPPFGSRRCLRGPQERAANGGTVPQMAEGASRTVRQAQQADWEEDSLLRLYLTTLAGTVIQLQVPVSIYHTWEYSC